MERRDYCGRRRSKRRQECTVAAGEDNSQDRKIAAAAADRAAVAAAVGNLKDVVVVAVAVAAKADASGKRPAAVEPDTHIGDDVAVAVESDRPAPGLVLDFPVLGSTLS